MLDMQEQLTRELRFTTSPAEQKQIKELLQSSTKLLDNKFQGLDFTTTREVDVSERKVRSVGLIGFSPEGSFETSFSINPETSLTQDTPSVVGLVSLGSNSIKLKGGIQNGSNKC